jgi:hypothetical protein
MILRGKRMVANGKMNHKKRNADRKRAEKMPSVKGKKTAIVYPHSWG